VYTEFFGLNEKPFSISPDPRYLYLSRRHADALAHLIYGVSESGGFIQLTGEVGTGKTTLIRSLLEQLPDKTEIALILNPQLSTKQFVHAICDELRIEIRKNSTAKDLIDSLNAHLLREHAEDRHVVLIVDEAQTLGPKGLEQVRLLTNLETEKTKLLQIILIGQPELRELLARPGMRQIAQRVTGRYHLEPLSCEDTFIYVKHRLKVAGARTEIFTHSAIRKIYRRSGGIPRLINIVADRALLAAYTQERATINGRLVRRAAAEVFGKRSRRRWWPWAAAAGLAVAVSALTTTNLWRTTDESQQSLADAQGSDALRVEVSAVEQGQGRSLAELFANPDFPTDVGSAIGELFRLWGADYDPTRGTPCSQAEQQGLRCLISAGSSLGQLRRIDRPVMLSLTDSNGTKHQVVMNSLDYDHADLIAGAHKQRVRVVDLMHHWFGEHLLLWKPSMVETERLRPGMQGEGVKWLRQSLASLRGAALANSESQLYDSELETWVREYQRDRELEIDGIVGAQTQIAIRTDLGLAGTPVLSKSH